MLCILLFIAIFLIAIYSYYKWHATYWKRLGIPGPEPTVFYGNWKTLANFDYPAPLQMRDWTKEYGKYYGVYEGVHKVLVVSDPDMLHELFVKKFENFYARKSFPLNANTKDSPRVNLFNSEGSRWKRLRTILSPTFTINNLKKIRPIVEDSALLMIKHMEKHVDSGKGFNILENYQEFTMDVIARTTMGQKGSRQFNNEMTDWIRGIFLRRMDNHFLYLASALPSKLAWVVAKLSFITSAMRGIKFVPMLKMIENTVDERRRIREKKQANGETIGDPEDFVDMFLEAENDDVDISVSDIDRRHVKVSKELSKQEIVAQCFVFLLAGFDTTANSLSYASYLLSKHPEVAQRMQDEIDTYCTEESISYEDLQNLKYMDSVVKETLRLYPLGGAIAHSRRCTKATTLGDVKIEKGVLVTAEPWTVHYDKKLWGEDADKFRPERWEENEHRHPLAWFPFGSGPRQCVGMRLAYMEEKMALAQLFRRYDVVEGLETEKTLHLISSTTVSPNSVTVYLKKRKQ